MTTGGMSGSYCFLVPTDEEMDHLLPYSLQCPAMSEKSELIFTEQVGLKRKVFSIAVPLTPSVTPLGRIY